MRSGTLLRAAVALGLLAALAVGLFLWTRTEPAPAVTTAGAGLPSLQWPEGTRYVYRLEWRTEQSTRVPVPGGATGQAPVVVDGSLRFSGTLVLRSFGRRGDAFLLGASLEELGTHGLRILGQEALPDAASADQAFAGREALFEVSPTGALRTMRFVPEDPDVFKHVMQGLLTAVHLTPPEDAAQRAGGSWSLLEPGPHGRVQARYEVDGAQPLTVRRVRTRYERLEAAAHLESGVPPHRLDSEASFTFEPAGHLRHLRHHERISARMGTEPLLDSSEMLQLTLLAVGRFTVPQDLGLTARSEERRPGEIVVGAAARQRLMEQRVAGLTMEQLLADLRRFGRGGQMPDHHRWFWRATGLLQQQPERCHELTALFLEPSLGVDGRGLVLDLLVGAGHPRAQAVLRELLETQAAKEKPAAHLSFLQRLGMLEQPDRETLEYVARQHALAGSRQPHLHNASAYTLGAVLGHLDEQTYAEQGASHGRMLVDALRRAPGPEERETYLRALGNAGRPENEEAVLAHLKDPDNRVRQAVASALRKVPSAQATRALLQLAEEKDVGVQATALDALRGHSLDAEALQRLHALAQSRALQPGTESLVVELLARRLEGGVVVRETLEAVLRMTKDAALRARILQLLSRSPRPAGP